MIHFRDYGLIVKGMEVDLVHPKQRRRESIYAFNLFTPEFLCIVSVGNFLMIVSHHQREPADESAMLNSDQNNLQASEQHQSTTELSCLKLIW